MSHKVFLQVDLEIPRPVSRPGDTGMRCRIVGRRSHQRPQQRQAFAEYGFGFAMPAHLIHRKAENEQSFNALKRFSRIQRFGARHDPARDTLGIGPVSAIIGLFPGFRGFRRRKRRRIVFDIGAHWRPDRLGRYRVRTTGRNDKGGSPGQSGSKAEQPVHQCGPPPFEPLVPISLARIMVLGKL